MKKVLGVLGAIGGLIVLIISGGIGNMGGKIASEAIFGPSNVVSATAQKINKKLPMIVDRGTRLDSTTAGPGRVLAYNYTLISYAASQLDASWLAALERQVVGVSCNQKQQNLLSLNVAMRYRYTSADGYMVKDFIINPNDCGIAPAPQSVVTPATVDTAPAPQPAHRRGTEVPKQERCEFKPVMTDHEIAVCRKNG